MSAPLKVTAEDLQLLSDFLQNISHSSRQTGVRLAPYGRTEVEVNGNVLSVSWDKERDQYVIDDRVGD